MILIALGSNLPGSYHSCAAVLRAAIACMDAHDDINVLDRSCFYETAPVPISDQPWYCNALITVETPLSPQVLLTQLQAIERDFGRDRGENAVRNAARTLDLDIIAYNDVQCDDAGLVLPHPRLHERAFVLYPLRDIAPDWRHPARDMDVVQMIDALPDDQDIRQMPRKLCDTQDAQIMGVVNVTPDSFSDGGNYNNVNSAIAHAMQLLDEGATILDIGGESTRPGAQVVDVDEEIARVVPVIQGIAQTGRAAWISIDTRNAKTMQAAIDAGANIINDISGLTYDPESMSVAAQSGAHILLMHSQGVPETMQDNPIYNNVVGDIYHFLKQQINACKTHRIDADMILIDPGIGFGKTLEHNVLTLRNIREFTDLGCEILLGTSRKSFIAALSQNESPSERLPGSLASILWARSQGVRLFRVHDVKETKQALAVYDAIAKAPKINI